jgi:hypothetical protein
VVTQVREHRLHRGEALRVRRRPGRSRCASAVCRRACSGPWQISTGDERGHTFPPRPTDRRIGRSVSTSRAPDVSYSLVGRRWNCSTERIFSCAAWTTAGQRSPTCETIPGMSE